MLRRAVIALVCFTTCLVSYCSAQGEPQTVSDALRRVPIDSILNQSLVGSKTTIVILTATGGTIDTVAGCGTVSDLSIPAYSAVFIFQQSLGEGSAGSVAIPGEVASFTPLAPGTRLGNMFSDNRWCCDDGNGQVVACGAAEARFSTWTSGLEVIKPANSTSLLFYSPEDVTGESLGVVTGPQDEFGFADVVLTKQGQPPVFSTILADTPLEPADRIVDIVPLEADAETGLGLYGAFVEY